MHFNISDVVSRVDFQPDATEFPLLPAQDSSYRSEHATRLQIAGSEASSKCIFLQQWGEFD
jgi:hypothetical protein